MKKTKICAILCAIICIGRSPAKPSLEFQVDSIDSDDMYNALTTVLHSVEELIHFYNDDYVNLNVDGFYGLRVLEGHTDAILQKYSRGQLGHLSLDIVGRLKVVKQAATAICKKADEHVKRDNVKYYNTMSFVVGSPWAIFDDTRRKVDPNKAWSAHEYREAKNTVMLDESQSDECMSELMGSHRVGGARCDIGWECVRVMTTPGLLAYSITHQLLWTMLADKAGCLGQLKNRLRVAGLDSLSEIRHDLCSNNYLQLGQTLAASDTINPDLQDLFLEQLFVCPSLGYYEFLSLDLLPEILAWQGPSGCFGESTDLHDDPYDPDTRHSTGTADTGFNLGKLIRELNIEDDNETSQSRQLAGGKHHIARQPGVSSRPVPQVAGQPQSGQLHEAVGIHQTANGGQAQPAGNGDSNVFDTQRNKGRKLLVEKEMAGGCLSHKTAVATGALIMYLRYLCEPDAPAIFNHTLRARSTHTQSYTDTDHRLRPAGRGRGQLDRIAVQDRVEGNTNNINNNISAVKKLNKVDQHRTMLVNSNSELNNKIKVSNQYVNVKLQTQRHRRMVTTPELLENPAHIAQGRRFIQPPLDPNVLGVIKPGRHPYQSPLHWQQGQLPETSQHGQSDLLSHHRQVDTGVGIHGHGEAGDIDGHQGELGVNRDIDSDKLGVAVAGRPANNKGADTDTEMYEYKYDNNDDDGDYDDDGDDGDDDENSDGGGDDDGANNGGHYGDEYDVAGNGNAQRKPAHHQLQLPHNGVHYNDNDVNKFNEEDNYDDGDDDDDGYGDDDYANAAAAADDTLQHEVIAVESPQGHINARNLVRAANKEHNKMYDNNEHNGDQNYKYDDYKDDDDDDDGQDEYAYDDKDGAQPGAGDSANMRPPTTTTAKPLKHSHTRAVIHDGSMPHSWSQSTLYMFMVFVIIAVLLVYRFLKKRKIRLRFHPSMLYKV